MEYSELINYSGLKNGKKPLQSQVNSNCYYLTEKNIYVVRNKQIVHEILLPRDRNDTILNFDCIFYEDEKIKVIIATRLAYSRSMILDEDKLVLTDLQFIKW